MKTTLFCGLLMAALSPLASAATSTPASAPASVSAPDASNARKDIQALVTTFQKAIVAKDGDMLVSLFLPAGSNWWSGFDDKTYAKVKARKPDAARANAGDAAKFAQFVKTTTHAPEEVFSNIHIQTDGNIGTVYFDYVFLLDAKPTNHGVETWQVIRTDAGWKISAMLYSEIHEEAK